MISLAGGNLATMLTVETSRINIVSEVLGPHATQELRIAMVISG